MGRVKNRMLDLESLYIGNVPNKNVCAKHIDNRFVKRFIKENYEYGYCDYCRKKVKVIHLEKLLEFMMERITLCYTDAVNFMSYDGKRGGYLGETFNADELIQDRIGLKAEPFELTEDIISGIQEIAWSQPDNYYPTPNEELMYHWEQFKNMIMFRSRYLFEPYQTYDGDSVNPYIILKEVGKCIRKSNLIKNISKDSLVYRCRQHKSNIPLDRLEDFTAPPQEKCKFSNRFSPAGISMLYATFDSRTSVKEVIDENNEEKDSLTIAKLKIAKDIKVIDFTNLPKYPDIFDSKKFSYRFLIQFLHDLVRDFSKRIEKDNIEHIEYVPTQVVTEYFRYHFNKNRKYKVDGLVYPSSRNENNSSMVLFWDDKESLKHLKLIDIEVQKTKSFI